MTLAARAFVLAIGCQFAGTLVADDAPPPDEGLIEFLGGWTDEDTVEDWLDFLEELAQVGGEAAPAGTNDARTIGNEDG